MKPNVGDVVDIDVLSEEEKTGNLVNQSFLFLNRRARDGTRTRGPDLGKVVLHQLSHSRISCCAGYVCRTHLISYSVNENLSTPFFIFFEKLEQFVILKRF